jgi:hypothetical protein
MDGTYHTHGAQLHTVLLLEDLNKRGHREDLGIDEMIILPFIFKK